MLRAALVPGRSSVVALSIPHKASLGTSGPFTHGVTREVFKTSYAVVAAVRAGLAALVASVAAGVRMHRGDLLRSHQTNRASLFGICAGNRSFHMATALVEVSERVVVVVSTLAVCWIRVMAGVSKAMVVVCVFKTSGPHPGILCPFDKLMGQ